MIAMVSIAGMGGVDKVSSIYVALPFSTCVPSFDSQHELRGQGTDVQHRRGGS